MLYKIVILSPSRKLQFIINPEVAKLSCALNIISLTNVYKLNP